MSDDLLRIENPCTHSAMHPSYNPLIRATIVAYRAVFADAIEEIRLMGSVARGEAIPGVSDIDFLALVSDTPSAATRTALDRHAATLGLAYPVVSLVDLGASRMDDLHPTQRFILTSDSIAVAGTDRLTLRQQTVPREKLICLVTPSMTDLLSAYHAAVSQLGPDDSDQLRFYSRVIGKDLLKCLRGVILRRGDTYERNISVIAGQALAHFPEYTATIALLRQCYLNPTENHAVLLRALAEAAHLPS